MIPPQSQDVILTAVGLTSAVRYAIRQVRAGRWRLAIRFLRQELADLAAQARRGQWSTIRRFNGWVAEPSNVGPGTAAYLTGCGLTRRRALRDLHRHQNRNSRR
ncbi:hypothetical protein [Nocardiopsis dassonvillei]|uniref:hypothetical protein n=1 Tax=Nocardiopsis dassonvillei TaxID=2014 RepID=UPI003642FBEB